MTFYEWYNSDARYEVFSKSRESVEFYQAVWDAATAAERERCAKIAETLGESINSKAPDPQEDTSDIAGEIIATAIRKGVTV